MLSVWWVMLTAVHKRGEWSVKPSLSMWDGLGFKASQRYQYRLGGMNRFHSCPIEINYTYLNYDMLLPPDSVNSLNDAELWQSQQ